MAKNIEIRNLRIYLDDADFALEIISGCKIQKSTLIQTPEVNWLTFDPASMDEHIEGSIREILNYIFDLRKRITLAL